jgi:hypothetical protein
MNPTSRQNDGALPKVLTDVTGVYPIAHNYDNVRQCRFWSFALRTCEMFCHH